MLAVLILNARRRIKGHQLISIGTMTRYLSIPAKSFAWRDNRRPSLFDALHPSGIQLLVRPNIKVTAT